MQSMTLRTRLNVDWLTLRFLLHGDEAEQVLSVLIGYAQDPESAGAYGVSRGGSKLSKGTQVALQFFAEKSREPLMWSETAAVSLRAKRPKPVQTMLVLDIHPPGLTAEGWNYVRKGIIEMILNRAPWEVADAKVTRIDYALDLHGVRLDDFAWPVARKHVRKAQTVRRKLVSLGSGKLKSGAVAIYDRTGRDGYDPMQPWTRIEARIKPGCRFADLSTVPNPFQQISVTDVRAAWKALGRGSIEATTMLSHAHLYGCQALVDLFPKRAPTLSRTAVRMALASAVPGWWKPDEMWSQLPDLFSDTPAGGEPSAEEDCDPLPEPF